MILNWNGRNFLQPCLESVFSGACEHVEVWVVDNGSTDDSVACTARDFPGAHVIAFTENLGFGRAYNAAVQQTSAPFVVFLNNDTVVERDWLGPLVSELICEPSVAITTSKVLFIGSRILNAAGGQLKLWQGGSEFGFGRDERFLDELKVVEPFYASGSAMAMPRELFLRLGGFDDWLWLYGEDLDLSWRARLAGYEIRCVPQSVVFHHYSATSGVFSPIKHRLVATHYLAVMLKCLSAANLVHSVPASVLFSIAKGTVLALAERNLAYFANPFLALRDTISHLGPLLLRRREAQRLRVAPDRQILQSEGFGLFETPWALLRVFRQGRRLKHALQADHRQHPH
jgi:GT2 family glycosyltransferase